MKPEFYSNPKFASLKTLKIGVLCGGSSSEKKISQRSGQAVYQALIKAGLKVRYLDPASQKQIRQGLPQIDVAFIALHGEGGEDGTIQRLLERFRVPYIGSDPKSSQNAFDKRLTKNFLIRAKIPTPESKILTKSNWKKGISRLAAPLFVKPPCEGSSIGVFPVEDIQKSAEKIKRAFERYDVLIFERKITGREFTVGVLGQKALPVIELKPRNPFYDFKAKYTKGMTNYLIPAPISSALARKLQKLALRTHRALGLRDFSRVDMMVDEKGKAYVLEANSIPGFTEFSLLPKAARAAGISFESLCSQLVFWAHERGNLKSKVVHGKKKK